MKAFIYAGGTVFTDRIDAAPAPADLTIAADAGWKTAQKLGVTPRLLVGDFDSLGTPQVSAEVEVVRVPAEKDDTGYGPFYYMLQNDTEWKAGYKYTYNVTITLYGLQVSVDTGSMTWGDGTGGEGAVELPI